MSPTRLTLAAATATALLASSATAVVNDHRIIASFSDFSSQGNLSGTAAEPVA